MNDGLRASGMGLDLLIPTTVHGVAFDELRDLITSMDYRAVVKVPYSNCGQGVFTMLNQAEMERFLAMPHHYDLYVVQSVIGSAEWADSADAPVTGAAASSPWFHRGCVVGGRPYVFDLRSLVVSTPEGFRPLAFCARRAAMPLDSAPAALVKDSFAMLGTNLTVIAEKGSLNVHVTDQTDTSRLHLVDVDYQAVLGLCRDDLVDAYIQSCLATRAIDDRAVLGLQAQGGESKHAADPALLAQLEPSLRDELLSTH